MAKTDRLKAELKVAELEEQLVEVKHPKGKGHRMKSDDDYRKLKLKLREARRVAREIREAD